MELKPSTKDRSPPEEETADTKKRTVETPDAEVGNNIDDIIGYKGIFNPVPWPVNKNDNVTVTLPALFDEKDIPHVNPVHYIIGREILEPFVVPKEHDDTSAAVTCICQHQDHLLLCPQEQEEWQERQEDICPQKEQERMANLSSWRRRLSLSFLQALSFQGHLSPRDYLS